MSIWREGVDRFRDMWDKFSRRSAIEDAWNKGDFPGGFPTEWESMGERAALSITSVFACVRIISSAIATVQLELLQDTEERKKKLLVDEPEYYLLAYGPNDETTSAEFFETSLIDALMGGECFHYVNRGGNGRPKEIWNLEPGRCDVQRYQGELIYRVGRSDGVVTPNVMFQGFDMWHMKRFSRDGVRGLSTLRQFAPVFEQARAQQAYSNSLYRNGMVVKSVIETDQTMETKEINRIEKMLDKKYNIRTGAGKPLILPFNLKFKNITMSPEDAQMIENFNFTEKDISKIFGVPLHMISNLDKATFSNIEQQQIEFVQNTLRSWATHIELSLRHHVLNSQQKNRGWNYRFNLDELTRGILADRFNAWNIGIQAGFLTPNEAREREDMDPKEGGDELKSPLNMEAAKDRLPVPPDQQKKGTEQPKPPAKEPIADSRFFSLGVVYGGVCQAMRKVAAISRTKPEQFDRALAIKQTTHTLSWASERAADFQGVEVDIAVHERIAAELSPKLVEFAQESEDARSDRLAAEYLMELYYHLWTKEKGAAA